MADKKYVIAIDAGTTGVRTLIVDLKGKIVGLAYHENPLKFPGAGLCELDAKEMVNGMYETTRTAMSESGIDANEIGGLSFTFMRSSFVLRKKDGTFVRDILMWQDLRCQERFDWMTQVLADKGLTPQDYYKKTAFPLHSTTLPNGKIYWVKEHEPKIYEDTEVIHTIHALAAHAYGVDGFIDDKEDIGWYGLHNGNTMEFDSELADIFGVDLDKYAGNQPAGTVIGHVTEEVAAKTGLVAGIPIVVGCGDHQCAAIGLGNNHEGLASLVMGTCGLLVGHSSKPVRDPSCAAWVVGTPMDGQYELECHSNAAASSFRWLRDAMYSEAFSITSAGDSKVDVYDIMTAIAAKANVGSDGLIYLPWNAGANCPHYDPAARGGFLGFTFAHGRPEITRAVMEGVVYDIRDMWETELKAGLPPFEVLRLSGGAARSSLWCQIVADVLNVPVETTENEEATALGAAMIASVGGGMYKDLQEAIDNMVHVSARYEHIPENVAIYDKLYKIFNDAYGALKDKAFPEINEYQGF